LIYGHGPIDVTLKDYECLTNKTFLNDKIIDFYLKWFQNERMSRIDRERSHIFSTYFYAMLTSQMNKLDVRNNWTKNINLSEKDFIVVPICEKKHWIVAVICLLDSDGTK
jgi:sentrin-specific protease 7